MRRLWIGLVMLLAAGPALAQYDQSYHRQRHRYGDELYIGSATAITGTWTCASGSTTCTEDATSGAATAELTAADIIDCNGRSYEIDSVTDDDSFERLETLDTGTVDTLAACTSKTVYIVNTGAPADTPAQLYDGGGTALPLKLSQQKVAYVVTLDEASGNEVACLFEYTTNKAAGDDTGIKVIQTDTASPGTSLVLELVVGASTKMTVTNTGRLTLFSLYHDSNQWALGHNSGLAFDSSRDILWSSTGDADGTKDLSLSRYNDGATTWLAVDDGGGDGTGDGAVMTTELMIGGTTGHRLQYKDGNYVGIRDTADSAFKGIYGRWGVFEQSVATLKVTTASGNSTLNLQNEDFNTGGVNAIEVATGTWTNTSGTQAAFVVKPTYNQTSGTAANTDLLVNRTETAVGSGAQLLADFQVSTVSKASIDNAGLFVSVGNIGAAPAATCTAGTFWIDTDETDDTNCTTTADNSLCLCVATDTWVAFENN